MKRRERRFHDTDGTFVDVDFWVNNHTGQPVLAIETDDGRHSAPYVIIDAREFHAWLGAALDTADNER